MLLNKGYLLSLRLLVTFMKIGLVMAMELAIMPRPGSTADQIVRYSELSRCFNISMHLQDMYHDESLTKEVERPRD